MYKYFFIIISITSMLMPGFGSIDDCHAATATCIVVYDNASTELQGCNGSSTLIIEAPLPGNMPKTHEIMSAYWYIPQEKLTATLAYFTERERLEIDAFLLLQKENFSLYSLSIPSLQPQTTAYSVIIAELFLESEDKQHLFLKISSEQKVKISNFTHVKFRGYPLIPVPIL